MKTVEVKLYNFNELTEEVQEKLIENNRHALVEFDDWHDPILEGFIEGMAEKGHTIDPDNISYSGFWSQGDGLSFTTKNGEIDVRSLLKDMGIKMKDLPRGFGKEIKQGLMTVDLVRFTNHYSHQYTVVVDLTYDGHDEKISQAFFDLEDKFESQLREYMTDLYETLEKYYDELTTDEAIKQELIEREDSYRESGELFGI